MTAFPPKTWRVSENSNYCQRFQQRMTNTSLRSRDSTKQRLDLGSACLKTLKTTLILTKLLRYVRLALTWHCLPLFIVAYQKWIHSRCPEIEPRTFRIASNKSYTEPCSPLTVKGIVMDSGWLVAKKSLNMMENMMDPNIIDYDIINCAIPSIITFGNCYQIDFGKPSWHWDLHT